MPELPEVLGSVVLGPEDRVILRYPSLSMEQYAVVRRELERAGFGDKALVAAGAEDSIVLRATKAEGSTVGQCGDSVPLVLSSGVLTCHLAHGHSGMHSDGSATWTNPAAIRLLCGNHREYPSGEFSVCSLRPGHEGSHVGDDDTWSNEGTGANA